MQDREKSDVSYYRQDKQPQSLTDQHPTTSSTPSHTPVPTPTPSQPLDTSSSPLGMSDKSTFKLNHESLVKSEVPVSSQYPPQEYSYAGVMPPHVGQAYLPHHMATDPSYLRRLEMAQPTSHLPTYTYPHTLPAADAMEPSLHM